MRKPKGVKNHQCAPKPWRGVSNITGDYDLDATIMHRSNKDMAARLRMHTSAPRGAYTPRSGYSGYTGNHGDD